MGAHPVRNGMSFTVALVMDKVLFNLKIQENKKKN